MVPVQRVDIHTLAFEIPGKNIRIKPGAIQPFVMDQLIAGDFLKSVPFRDSAFALSHRLH